MATASKLNQNLLLYSFSKRTPNLRSNLCCFKLRTNSNFCGFKVENFALNSTSSLSSKRPCFENFSGFKAESFSTTNNNVVHPLDPEAKPTSKSMSKAFMRLKSKIPVIVMASCLLGMMMINCRKPALAFWGGGGYPVSSSSSSSSSLSFTGECPLCLSGCIFCAVTPKEDGSGYNSPLLKHLCDWLFLHCVIMSVVMIVAVAVLVYILFSSNYLNMDWFTSCLKIQLCTSNLKIQVGLLASESLQYKLSNLIGRTHFYSQFPQTQRAMLEGTIKTLNQYSNDWISGHSSVNFTFFDYKNGLLQKLIYEEQNKFNEMIPVNQSNMKRKSITGLAQQVDESSCNNFMVVTILVGVNGIHKLPTIRKSGDLDQALKKLKKYGSKLELRGLDVCWAPNNFEITSIVELEKHYPLLRSLNTPGSHQKHYPLLRSLNTPPYTVKDFIYASFVMWLYIQYPLQF